MTDPNFARFWQTYPRKRSKLDALRAWNKLAPDEATVQDILAAIPQHARTKNWREGFVPYPATWLRRGAWMDELGEHDFVRARL